MNTKKEIEDRLAEIQCEMAELESEEAGLAVRIDSQDYEPDEDEEDGEEADDETEALRCMHHNVQSICTDCGAKGVACPE